MENVMRTHHIHPIILTTNHKSQISKHSLLNPDANFSVSWKSRVLGFGHAELNIGDADIAEIARLYRGHILVL
jgi:hypothetical protein